MTTREVEVEHTVTETENVKFCDYCGEDEDAGKDDIVTYSPDDYRRSPLLGDDSGDNQKLHFHKDCLKLRLGDMGEMPQMKDLSEQRVLRVYDGFDLWASRVGTLFLMVAVAVGVLAGGLPGEIIVSAHAGALSLFIVGVICKLVARGYGTVQADEIITEYESKGWL